MLYVIQIKGEEGRHKDVDIVKTIIIYITGRIGLKCVGLAMTMTVSVCVCRLDYVNLERISLLFKV